MSFDIKLFVFLFRIYRRYSSDSDSISSSCSAGRHSLYQLYSQWECLLPLKLWPLSLAGTCRNLVRLLNFSFIAQQIASLGFLIVSVGVDLGLSLHWKSLEFRLKMQEIIIVRVFTTPTVKWCSHSDTEPYKNLPQSDCRETAVLQLGPAAGAEGGGTDLEHWGALL